MERLTRQPQKREGRNAARRTFPASKTMTKMHNARMSHVIRRRGAETGSGFQEAVNRTNEAYEKLGRACITRKAIPGKFVAPREPQRRGLSVPDAAQLAGLKTGARLDAAAFRQAVRIGGREGDPRDFVPESRAEPDYGGCVAPSGRAIFYDAKSTQRELLDFDNLHPHQVAFLERTAACGAIAGFLVEFAAHRRAFFLPIQVLTKFRAVMTRKSVPYGFFLAALTPAPPGKGMVIYDYLAAIEAQEARYGRDYGGVEPAAIMARRRSEAIEKRTKK
jgi:recombination protein U